MVLPTYLAIRSGMDGALLVCWGAASVYITVLGIGFFLRFRAGHWRKMSVIERTEPPDEAVPAGR